MDQKMEESILYAKKYLEDLLSFFGLNTDVKASHDEDVIELNVPTTHLNGFLIGQHGETLRSIQFLISSALKNNDYAYTRINVDIADYKKNRAERLAAQVEGWIEQVKSTNQPMELKPMNAVDRRTVHGVVGEHGGVESKSSGEGRDRRVVITPLAQAETADE